MRCILILPGPLGIGIIALNRVVLAPDEKNGISFSARACASPVFFQKESPPPGPFQDGAKNRSKIYRTLTVHMGYTSSFPKIIMQNGFLKLHFVTFERVSRSIIMFQF